MAPRVSILMAIYNGGHYLEGAVQSVMDQDYQNYEFIIIDDGSIDDTWPRLQALAVGEPRIKLIRNPQNLGLTRSLNLGLDHAQGEYMARLDVDDLWLPAKLRTQLDYLKQNPQVALLGSAALRICDQGNLLPEPGRHPTTYQAIRLKMLLSNAFFHSSVLVNLNALSEQKIRYDPAKTYAQDYDLWSRLLTQHQGANLAQPLIKFRAYSGQLSTTAWEEQQSLGDVIAWENFQRMGLNGRFTPSEVSLMRRTGVPPGQISPQDRLRQFRSLLRLFQLIGDLPGLPGQEWIQFKRSLLFYSRRHLVAWPRDLATLKTQTAMAALDLPGACRDIAAWLLQRIKGSGGKETSPTNVELGTNDKELK